MGLAQVPLFAALTEKMRWHQARQGLLAENVANAETPGFRARDLRQFDFATQVKDASTATVITTATNPGHFAVQSDATAGFRTEDSFDFETTPEGNAVSLEDQMMKVTANQMDYQAVTTLYTRSMRILRVALGRSA
jgi:flagellar basal-body rod protein FlgB